MPTLYWFHAFDRDIADKVPDVGKVLEVLRNGPGVHPDPQCSTRRHERALQIAPPRVYAYAGRTLQNFGVTCLVLPPAGITKGEISPFDTGGLVNQLQPVAAGTDGEKARYLEAYSWGISDLSECLAVYPDQSPGYDKYLSTERPPQPGPHAVWPNRGASHDLWASNDHWRAWTWEGRTEPTGFQISQIKWWTSSPDLAEAVKKLARQQHKNEKNFLLRLESTYRQGGVGPLVQKLIAEQAAA